MRSARARLGLLVALAATAASLVVPATSSAAPSPWWGLTSSSRPSHLKIGTAQEDVQEIDLTLEGGQGAFGLNVGKTELGFFVTEPLAAELELPALTAANIEAALEGPYGPPYGPGVSVTEVTAEPEHLRFRITMPARDGASISVENLGLGAPEAKVVNERQPDGQIVASAENLGDASAEGGLDPIEISDTLPPHLKAVGISGWIPGAEAAANGLVQIPCSLATLTCSLEGLLLPYDAIEVRIAVIVESGAQSGELNEVRASGGGARPDSVQRPIVISGDPTPFGIEQYELSSEEEGGLPGTQAGSHPFQQTSTIVLNQGRDEAPLTTPAFVQPAGLIKDGEAIWPPGMIGNPTATPRCTLSQFLIIIGGVGDECPAESAVGVAVVNVNEPGILGLATFTMPLFNLQPAPGEPARFGFYVTAGNVPVVIDTALRSDGDYGISVISHNVSQTAAVLSVRATVWGVPGDPRHDNSRGWGCLYETREANFPHEPCTPSNEKHPKAFIQMPTACSGAPLATTLLSSSWDNPGVFDSLAGLFKPTQPLDGCNKLPFAPKIESSTTSDSGETGSGFDFNLDFNDGGIENPEGLVESQVNKAVVTTPEGLTINPSVGEGLGVCTPADIKRETLQAAPGEGCPNSSKLGTIEATSPLIEEAVKGSVFLAQEDDKATSAPGAENPFDSLIALYLVLKNPKLGVIIKKPVKIEPNEKTGQLVATIEEVPQIPLSHFNFHFKEGARAPLITPAACGAYTTNAKFYPWSNPQTPTEVSASFKITRGVNGGPCPPGGLPPFHPHFEAGALNNNAGSFSPFNMRLTRADGEQDMTKFSAILPPGELGSLAGVSKCPDSAIAIARSKTGRQELDNPSCPANSLIGHTLAGAGVGEALTYVKGQIYLGGPYHGDPLSVISVTPALAGPFDAGTVVVRLALTLNPKTAEVEVDGANSDPIPHILDGIVLKVRDLRVYVDRHDFTLNPTNCEESSAKAKLFGSYLNVFDPADDVPVDLSSRYQAANCASLGFKPNLKLNLKGGTKRGGHPGLIATYVPRKGDANVKGLVVRLPRSAFLDQAHIRTICTRVQFAAKACPPAAQYGYIKAWTPLLDTPLEGPVWLRSSNHKLPDLVFDLHGLVDVEVSTRIDSAHGGIRASIESAPDAPLTKVLLRMQGGKKGLIVNSRNLCGAKSKANVDFTGQNGKQSHLDPVMRADCGGKRKGKRSQR